MIIDTQLDKVQGSDVRITVEFGKDREMKPLTFLLKNFQLNISAEPEKEFIDGKLHYKLSSERKVSIHGVMKEDT